MVPAMTTTTGGTPPTSTPAFLVGGDLRRWITAAIVAAATAFVVWNLRPWVWFVDTTPTGGDLGAHVWSPAYLRDVLLPSGRLTGWTPDWYAGFPAFTFYMIVPSLLIVMVNVGLDVPIAAVALMSAGLAGYLAAHRVRLPMSGRVLAAAGAWSLAVVLREADGTTVDLPIWRVGEFTYSHTPFEIVLAAMVLPAAVGLVVHRALPAGRWRKAAVAAAVVLAVVAVPVPYGVAMKLVVVSGLVTLPVAAWATGQLAGLAYPGPALLSLMTLPFIFDRSFNIYGGNLMSTMAGEFAYSVSLTLAVLCIGVTARGLDTGRHRGLAAVLLALTGLTHLFPAFFALVAIAAMLLVRFGRRSFSWLMVAGPLAGLLAAFWVLPFVWNTPYLNDMGWGKERRYVEALWSRGGNFGDQAFLDNDPVLQVFVVLAIVGAVLSGVRRVRFGIVMSITAMAFAAAFVLLPESRLWNVRILPFYYLSIYLMAGIGVAEGSRWVFGAGADAVAGVRSGLRSPAWRAGVPAMVVTAVVMISLAVPLRALPFGETDSSGEYGYSWSGGVLSTSELNLGPYWLSYNFRGYEDKTPTEAGGGTSEYTDMVATMARVGDEHGCGRALWEYESDRLGSYGTTMAPMLLPHWTDGCIGSMEGLYFEASATTPYHFLLQSELSSSPSRAQRDLPYSGLDVEAGVAHLQTLGVRYYMAFSEGAIAQARAQPELTEIAWSGPWVVFSVADSDLVVGLDHLPVVVDGADAGGEEWLVPSVASWEAGSAAPLVAASGPDDWPRADSVDVLAATDDGDPPGDDRVGEIRHIAEQLPDWLDRTEVEPVEISDVVTDEFSISFSVDEIGAPVLVRTSYFPNWTVSGADGPYRVAPNLMVVVPTELEVELSYGRSGIEWFSMLLTVLGLAGLVGLGRVPMARGGDRWDLAAPGAARLSREELVAGLRSGSLDRDDIGALQRREAEHWSAAFWELGIAAMLIGASLIATAFVAEHAEAPLTALAVWLPAAIGLILLVFRAGPRALESMVYRRWTLAPAALIAELVDDHPPDAAVEPPDPVVEETVVIDPDSRA